MAKYLKMFDTELEMDNATPEVKPWVGANQENKKVRYVAKQA